MGSEHTVLTGMHDLNKEQCATLFPERLHFVNIATAANLLFGHTPRSERECTGVALDGPKDFEKMLVRALAMLLAEMSASKFEMVCVSGSRGDSLT